MRHSARTAVGSGVTHRELTIGLLGEREGDNLVDPLAYLTEVSSGGQILSTVIGNEADEVLGNVASTTCIIIRNGEHIVACGQRDVLLVRSLGSPYRHNTQSLVSLASLHDQTTCASLGLGSNRTGSGHIEARAAEELVGTVSKQTGSTGVAILIAEGPRGNLLHAAERGVVGSHVLSIGADTGVVASNGSTLLEVEVGGLIVRHELSVLDGNPVDVGASETHTELQHAVLANSSLQGYVSIDAVDGIVREGSALSHEVGGCIVDEERDAGGIVASLAVGTYQGGHLIGACGQRARNLIVDVAVGQRTVATVGPVLDERGYHASAVAVALGRPGVDVEVAKGRLAHPVQHRVVGHLAGGHDLVVEDLSLHLVDGGLEGSDGSLQALLGLLDVGGSLEGSVGNSVGSLVGILVALERLELSAQLVDGVQQRCELHILDLALGTVVGQLEGIPDAPGVRASAAHTNLQGAVLDLHEQGLHGVLASGEALCELRHVCATVGFLHVVERSGLVVGKHHGIFNTVVSIGVVGQGSLGGHTIDAVGHGDGLCHGEGRLPRLSAAVADSAVGTTVEVGVRSLNNPCALVAVVAREVGVLHQDGGVEGVVDGSLSHRSNQLIVGEHLPQSGGSSAILEVECQLGRCAVVADELLNTFIVGSKRPVVASLGNGQRQRIVVVHEVVLAEEVAVATIRHTRVEQISAVLLLVERHIVGKVHQRGLCAPGIAVAHVLRCCHVAHVVVAVGQLGHVVEHGESLRGVEVAGFHHLVLVAIVHGGPSVDEHQARAVDVDVVLVVELEEPRIVGITRLDDLNRCGLSVGQRVVGVQILLGTYGVDVEVVVVVDESHLLVGILLVRVLGRAHGSVGEHPRASGVGHLVSLLVREVAQRGDVDRWHIVGVVLDDNRETFHLHVTANDRERCRLGVDVGAAHT